MSQWVNIAQMKQKLYTLKLTKAQMSMLFIAMDIYLLELDGMDNNTQELDAAKNLLRLIYGSKNE